MQPNLIAFISLTVLFFACAPQETADKLSRPNIIFIMTDDHSFQTFSAYQDHLIQTPNLDRIANEGALFVNSFVSNSICAPSRAVMLTGKHSHLNGQLDNRIRFDSSQATFPKYLQDTGYQTAIVGKWHLKSQPMGFDHYEVLIGQGNYYNSDFIENGVRRRSEGYVTDVITDKSLAWLEQRDRSRPFCLLLHHKATHRIWFPDTALFDEFEDLDIQPPTNFFDDYEGRRAAAEQEMSIAKDMDLVWDNKMLDPAGDIKSRLRDPYEKRMYGRLNSAQKNAVDNYYHPIIEDFKAQDLDANELALWKFRRYMQDYLRCVRSVDNNIGRVLQYLDENNLTDNTLVVYTSDQGFYMGEHGWFDKRFMYEESMRTPLVMRWPRHIPAKTEIKALVQNIDYAPTLMHAAGLTAPVDMQGKSLVSLWQDPNNEFRSSLYYHYYEYPGAHSVKRHYGIRTNRFKLIHFYHDIDNWELYDLEEDPQEMNNLIDDPEQQSRISELKGHLKKLRQEYLVPEDVVTN